MARPDPRVFTIQPGMNFTRLVVEALLDGRLINLPFRADPALLADLVIYVPTQRIRPILEAEFAAALAPRPAILPKIRPLAEPGDPLERLLAMEDTGGLIDPALITRTEISPIKRRFLLLPMVERWRAHLRAELGEQSETGPAAEDGAGAQGAAIRESLALADALARLIDEMRIANVPLETLASSAPPGYDPAKFDAYWEKTREFLRIAARYWPAALAEAGACDAMDLRLAGIEAEARRLVASDPAAPVLVVGSTGSVPATAWLMRAVARLDHGAVVLPGLDLTLDDRGWDHVGSETASLATRFAHPQAVLKRALAEIGIPREAVHPLASEPPAIAARNRVITEALRPAESVDAWRQCAADIDLEAALSGVTLIEAQDEREEALAIAILMRQTLEREGATIALVTADRALARRVKNDLRRWKIEAEDSAGTSLAERPAGIFLRLFLGAANLRDGGAILALMRHPLFRLGFGADRTPRLVDAIDLLVFRGRHFSPAQPFPERVRHALANTPPHAHPAARRIDAQIRADLMALAGALEQAFAPFSPGAPARLLADFAADLTPTLIALSRDETGVSVIESDTDATALAGILADLVDHAGETMLAPEALGAAIDVFLAERVLPAIRRGHPRAAILGPLESRLVSAERLVIGSLNEGGFPPVAEDDPFLNRAMRLDLGLQPPERRIGQSAHDFSMLAGTPDVVLSRARRVGDQPATPSRFLRRLEAFAGEAHVAAMRGRGEAVLTLARALDAPEAYSPIEAPAPIPQKPRVPQRLSITEIETLRRDPYAIYARHILALEPLEPIDPELDARERGTILHACLDAYARDEPPRDPTLAAQLLREIGTELFEPIRHEPELFEFWWQRFLAIIPDFVAFDREQRDAGRRVLSEVRGKVSIELDGGEAVTLSGKADRIEIGADGRFSVLDYKSGTPPGDASVQAGLSPQLPITAAMAARGAFDGARDARSIESYGYVPIGGNTPLEPRWIKPGKERDAAGLAEENWQRLARDLTDFAGGHRSYRSRIALARGDRSGDYDHLARVGEWSMTGATQDEGDEPGEEGS